MLTTLNFIVVAAALAGFLLTFQRSATRGLVLLVIGGATAIVGDIAINAALDDKPWLMLSEYRARGMWLLGVAFAGGVLVSLLSGLMRK